MRPRRPFRSAIVVKPSTFRAKPGLKRTSLVATIGFLLLNFIRTTSTKTGLEVAAYLDRRHYPTSSDASPKKESSSNRFPWTTRNTKTADLSMRKMMR